MGLLHSQQHQSTGENLTGKTRLQEISAHGHLARKTPLTDSWTAEKEIPPQHLLQIPERTPPHWDKAQSLNRWPPKKKHLTQHSPSTAGHLKRNTRHTYEHLTYQWPHLWQVTLNSRHFRVLHSNTDQYRNSFTVCTTAKLEPPRWWPSESHHTQDFRWLITTPNTV